nr:hypothetical protein [Bacteroides intestinalis]
MKKYVIIIPNIGNMGGGQMYVRNKMLWLRKNGWKVDIVYCTAENVVLSELNNVGKQILDIEFSYYFTPKCRRKHIIDEMYEYLYEEKADEYIIETTSIPCATWGEVLALSLGAKHFVYLINESNVLDTNKCFDFLYFKHGRKELASITNTSLQQMFERYVSIPVEKSYSLSACCINVVEDCDNSFCEIINEQKVDYVLGCLGRLDKPFIFPMLSQLNEYIMSHENKQFLLLMIGGAPIGSKIDKEVHKIFANIGNVKLILTGYMFPVSRKLISMCDVFISSAGSAWATVKEGIPTISMDGNDYLPIGVLGRTTNSSLFRSDEELPLSLSDLLDDILFNKIYKKDISVVDSEPEFDDHLNFVRSGTKDRLYYDMNSIKLAITEQFFLKVGLLTLGAKGYCKLSNLKSKFKIQ